jgi:cell division protease FtsH
MVTQYGMSAKLGPMTFGQKDSQPFLGRDFGHQPDYSGEVAIEIDREIRALIDEAHDEALEVLVANRHVLEELADKLMERETVEKEELAELLGRVTARPSRKIQPLMNGSGALGDGDLISRGRTVVGQLRRLRPGAVAPASGPPPSTAGPATGDS